MGLKDNLSRLSPNKFLEKMQDMFQMYQESQDDYYEEGIKKTKFGSALSAGILAIASIKDEERRRLTSEEMENYMIDKGALPSPVGKKLSDGLRLVLAGLRDLEENAKRKGIIDGIIGSIGLKKYLRE